MKSEVKKLDASTVEIAIEADSAQVKAKFEDVFTRIGKEAKIKGFRPGHTPRDIIEKQFSQHATDQVMKEMIPDLYGQVVESEKLAVIDMPDISDIKIERDALSFKAKVELTPEIQLNDYKGIQIDYTPVSVSEDEIKRNVDSLKEARKIDVVDDAFARTMGYPSLDELKKSLERQIAQQKDNLQRQKIESHVIESITKGQDFRLPKAMLAKQLDYLVRQAKIDLALKGITKEQMADKEKALITELEPEAHRQVKIYLILSAIAKKENIAQDDHMPQRTMEFLFREATWKQAA